MICPISYAKVIHRDNAVCNFTRYSRFARVLSTARRVLSDVHVSVSGLISPELELRDLLREGEHFRAVGTVKHRRLGPFNRTTLVSALFCVHVDDGDP
jgi:hypothetical protein